MRITLFLILSLYTTLASAQEITEQISRVQHTDSLSSSIRSSKSVVLLKVDGDNAKEWSRVANMFQNEIRKGGIDAVAYYNYNEFYAGWDVVQSYIADFTKRGIEHIILLHYAGEKSSISVSGLDPKFLGGNAKITGYTLKGDYKEITRRLYVKAANSGYALENLLINDQAEMGPPTKPFGNDIGTYFAIGLKNRKLAVPRTGDLQRDQLMEIALKEHYTFEYEFVAPGLSDEEIRDMDYTYVLRFVEAKMDVLRELCGYENKTGVTEYSSVIRRGQTETSKSIPITQNVSKFYVRDLNSKKALMGTEWDVDTNWSDALKNHLSSIMNQLNR